MIYVKSFATGLAAFIVAALLTIVILFARVAMSSGGGVGVIEGPGWAAPAVSFLAFAAGFSWQYRRAR
jgi:hypothetical protein